MTTASRRLPENSTRYERKMRVSHVRMQEPHYNMLFDSFAHRRDSNDTAHLDSAGPFLTIHQIWTGIGSVLFPSSSRALIQYLVVNPRRLSKNRDQYQRCIRTVKSPSEYRMLSAHFGIQSATLRFQKPNVWRFRA